MVRFSIFCMHNPWKVFVFVGWENNENKIVSNWSELNLLPRILCLIYHTFNDWKGSSEPCIVLSWLFVSSNIFPIHYALIYQIIMMKNEWHKRQRKFLKTTLISILTHEIVSFAVKCEQCMTSHLMSCSYVGWVSSYCHRIVPSPICQFCLCIVRENMKHSMSAEFQKAKKNK